jgi:prolyl oligopeptidase
LSTNTLAEAATPDEANLMRARLVLFAAGVLALAAGHAAAKEDSRNVVAPIHASQMEYFGTVVRDPYHWMERSDDPDLVAWIAAQNERTRGALNRAPLHEDFLRRVQALSGATIEIKNITPAGGRLFFLKRASDGDDFALCVRDGIQGKERVLVDPVPLTTHGVHSSIDFIMPSPDGKLVAYALSPGGSEESVLHLVDAASGQPLSEAIDRAVTEPMWRADNRSFFYSRLQQLAPDAPPTAKFEKVTTFLHVVGTNPRHDVAVVGFGTGTPVPVAPNDFVDLFAFPAADKLVVRVTRAGQHWSELYVLPPQHLSKKDAPWRKVADPADQVELLDAHGDDLYLLSHRDPRRSTLVRVNMAHYDAAHAVVVLDPGELVLQGARVASDALYVRANDAGRARLFRVPYAQPKPLAVALPFDGAINMLATDPFGPGVIFKLQSWMKAPAIYAYAPDATVSNTHLLPPSAIDVTNFESEEVTVAGSDGVSIPLSIVHLRGLKLDSSAPTWLSVYGSYGISSEPRFEPRRIAWLEHRGLYAVCHARGGGERGEGWHRAGMKQNKQHTIDDAIACARYLNEHRYTAPAHLAIEGASAGGLAAGGALTQRPELFGASVLRVAILDLLAFERSAGGNANTGEFGSSKVREEFPSLLAVSPYHRVRNGVRYPAVLLAASVNDRRVPLAQATKMAARLQAATSSGKPILLRIEEDAGHGLVGDTRAQIDAELADIYSFLWWQLGGDGGS